MWKWKEKKSHQPNSFYIKEQEMSNCSKGNSKLICVVREMPEAINK